MNVTFDASANLIAVIESFRERERERERGRGRGASFEGNIDRSTPLVTRALVQQRFGDGARGKPPTERERGGTSH
jgi:hypothetical protein